MRLSAGSPGADAATVAPTWGWAVVEIRRDGTWGRPRVVPAAGPEDAAASAAATDPPVANHLRELAPVLHAHLGTLHVSNGSLHQAALALTQGTGPRVSSAVRADCLARLAHVEAIQGELRRASRHASLVPKPGPTTSSPGVGHAHLARAWIALERTDFAGTAGHLDALASVFNADQEPWVATSRLLVEARQLIATDQPDAATRLLAGASELASSPATGWLSDLLTIAKAEALLASGEPQRALATVTPMPGRAIAEATVVAAAARRGIGDLRGAQAVLSRALAELDRAPLAVQIQAWLLESQLAEDRGKHERARLVADRALRSATAEQMRRPLIHDWRWLRRFVDRDPGLSRSHRDFLSTCHLGADAPCPAENA